MAVAENATENETPASVEKLREMSRSVKHRLHVRPVVGPGAYLTGVLFKWPVSSNLTTTFDRLLTRIIVQGAHDGYWTIVDFRDTVSTPVTVKITDQRCEHIAFTPDGTFVALVKGPEVEIAEFFDPNRTLLSVPTRNKGMRKCDILSVSWLHSESVSHAVLVVVSTHFLDLFKFFYCTQEIDSFACFNGVARRSWIEPHAAVAATLSGANDLGIYDLHIQKPRKIKSYHLNLFGEADFNDSRANLVQLYEDLYFVYGNMSHTRLVLKNVTRPVPDCIIGSEPGIVEITTVDNLLLAHRPANALVTIYDVADSSVSQPDGVFLEPTVKTQPLISYDSVGIEEPGDDPVVGDYLGPAQYLLPNIIVNIRGGEIYKTNVNLEAIMLRCVAEDRNPSETLSLLLRRMGSIDVCVELIKYYLSNELELDSLRELFDSLHQSVSYNSIKKHAVNVRFPLNSNDTNAKNNLWEFWQEIMVEQIFRPLIGQSEGLEENYDVFAAARDQYAKGIVGERNSQSYVLAALIEYWTSLRASGLCTLWVVEELVFDFAAFLGASALISQLFCYRALSPSEKLLKKMLQWNAVRGNWLSVHLTDLAFSLREWDVLVKQLCAKRKYFDVIPILKRHNASDYPLRYFLEQVAQDVDAQQAHPGLLEAILNYISAWREDAKHLDAGTCAPNLTDCDKWL